MHSRAGNSHRDDAAGHEINPAIEFVFHKALLLFATNQEINLNDHDSNDKTSFGKPGLGRVWGLNPKNTFLK